MKKQLLTILGVLLLAGGLFSQNNKMGQGNQVTNITGTPKQKLTKNWSAKSSQFVDYRRNLYMYNANNFQTQDLQQDSAAGFFKNKSKVDNFYNATKTDQIDSSLNYTWTNNAWAPSFKFTATYTSFGGPATYNLLVGTILYLNVVYTYDGNDHIASARTKQFGGLTLDNSDSTHFTVDGNGNPLTEEQFKWNKNTSKWDLDKKSTSTFDGNNKKLTQLTEKWNGTNFENSVSSVYTYDANHNELTLTIQSWKNNAWENASRTTSFYKNGTERDYQLSEVWSTGANAYANSQKFIWDDNIATGISNVFANTSLFTLFPNPSFENTNIMFTTTIPAVVKVTVLDASGKEVMVIANEMMAGGVHTMNASTNSLAKGLYFISLQNGGTISTQKLIVE